MTEEPNQVRITVKSDDGKWQASTTESLPEGWESMSVVDREWYLEARAIEYRDELVSYEVAQLPTETTS